MKLLLIISSLCILIFSCNSQTQFEYYYNADKTEVLTIMKYEARVYFIPGYYGHSEPPKSYLTPVSGMDNAYSCYVEWVKSECIITTMFGDWQVVGNPQKITLRKVKDTLDYNKITKDKTGRYLSISGNIFP